MKHDTDLGKLNGGYETDLGIVRDSSISWDDNVDKSYGKEFDCKKLAKDVFHRLRTRFPRFANFTGNFGLFGAPATMATVTFSETPITKGAVISIENINMINGPPAIPVTINYNVSVTVNSVSVLVGKSMSFSFVTNEGHVLHPATIWFFMSDTAPGKIHFSIHVRGNYAGTTDEVGYYLGGNNLEDKIWNNVVNNVSKYCGNK